MPSYSRLSLQNAYLTGATEIADKILKDVYDTAKYSSHITSYENKTYIDKLIAERVLEILKNSLADVEVTMILGKEEYGNVMVTYRIDWS